MPTKRRARRPANRLLLTLLVLLPGCARREPPGSQAAGPERPRVLVTNYPLMYFAQRIGGGAIDVRFPVPRDSDPAYWKPAASDVAQYQAADLILLNGASYEKWAATVSLPLARVVDTARAVQDRLIVIEEAVVHQHGPAGEHSHVGTAFTTWFDPTLALEQSRQVNQALCRVRPDSAAAFQQNFLELERDLLALDARLSEITGRQPGLPLFASHPIYDYLQRRYRLALESVHWEPDEVPDEAAWQQFVERAQRHPARWMLWEAPPRPETIDRLRAAGVECVVVEPVSNIPTEGDFLSVMRRNADRLERVFPVPATTGQATTGPATTGPATTGPAAAGPTDRTPPRFPSPANSGS